MSKKRKIENWYFESSKTLVYPSFYDITRCAALVFSPDLVDYEKSKPKEISKIKVVQEEPNLYDHLIE